MGELEKVRDDLRKEAADHEVQRGRTWAESAHSKVKDDFASDWSTRTDTRGLVKRGAIVPMAHPSAFARDLLKRLILADGWHFFDIEKSGYDKQVVWYGLRTRPITVHLEDGDSFAVPYEDDTEEKEVAARAALTGAWRAHADRWEFVPPHRISRVEVGDPVPP